MHSFLLCYAMPVYPGARPGGVPGQTPAPAVVASPTTAVSIQALAPARYKVQFTASAALVQKLERLKALMRSAIPDGDLAAIVEVAVTEKLARHEARRFALVAKPRKQVRDSKSSCGLRYVPAAVRRAVYAREGGRCRFVDSQGRRCGERDDLEFHHRHPFGHNGSHEPDNLSLLCRAHNAYLAEIDYGKRRPLRPPAPGQGNTHERFGVLAT